MNSPSGSRLEAIADKVKNAERLSFDDGVFLEEHADLFALGELANIVRERKNGRLAYYNVNTHLNPTNVCVYRCSFCAFRADLRDPRGYRMSDAEILQRGQEAAEAGCTELHIVGGLHHQMDYGWYLNVVRMHVMIFVFAFAGSMGLTDLALYPLLILYFFPFISVLRMVRSSPNRESGLSP